MIHEERLGIKSSIKVYLFRSEVDTEPCLMQTWVAYYYKAELHSWMEVEIWINSKAETHLTPWYIAMLIFKLKKLRRGYVPTWQLHI